MKKEKTLGLLLSFALVAVLFSACGGGDAQQQEEESPAAEAEATEEAPSESPLPAEGSVVEAADKRDTLIVITELEPPSITPFDHAALASGYVNKLTYAGLFELDMDLNPQPHMVESYEAESDTIWVMKLKEGMTFHNGDPVTAEDVKASLEYTATFPNNLQYTTTVTEVEVVDELTCKIKTEEPSAKLFTDLAHHSNAILPKGLIDGGHDFTKEAVGAGPYVFKEWILGDRIIFEGYDDFFQPENVAKIKNLEWRIVPEGTSRTISLEMGEADYDLDTPATDIERLEANPDINVALVPGTVHGFFMLNNERYPFDNLDFRRGMACAINPQDVIDVALNGLGTLSLTQVPESLGRVSVENTETYNPDKAWEYFNASGIDPSTIEFDAQCASDEARRTCEVVQASLLEYGITVNITQMDVSAVLAAQFAGEFDTGSSTYTASSLLSYLGGVCHSKMLDGSNRSRLNDAQVDALIDKAEVTIDPDERQEVIYEVTGRINELMPQIPLYMDMVKRSYNANLGGVEIAATGSTWFNKMYWK